MDKDGKQYNAPSVSTQVPWKAMVPWAVLMGVAIFFFSAFLYNQKFPYVGDYTGSDLTDLNLPFRYIASMSLREGKIPLWHDGLSNGFPLFAEGQAGVLYPLNIIIYTAFPFAIAVTVSYLIHFFLASCFTYMLSREWGVSAWGAVFAGIVFAYGGYFVFRMQHVNLINAAIWLPLEWWCITRAMKGERVQKKYALMTGVLFAVQFFAGHPQVTYISIISGVLYSCVLLLWERHAWRRWVEALVWWIIAGGVGLGLAAIQVFPSLELADLSVRNVFQGFEFSTRFSYHPRQMLMFVAPFIFGNPAIGTYDQPAGWGGFWESNAYVGITPLLLAGAALVGKRENRGARGIWMAMIALVAGLFVFGAFNPVFKYVWQWVPGMQWFRFPQRFLLVVVLALALLAGMGYDQVQQVVVKWIQKHEGVIRLAFVKIGMPLVICAVAVLEMSNIWGQYVGAVPYEYAAVPASANVMADTPRPFRILSAHWGMSWPSLYRGAGGWLEGGDLFLFHREVIPPNVNIFARLDAAEDRALNEGGQTVRESALLWTTLQASAPFSAEERVVKYTRQGLKLWGMQNVRYFLSFMSLKGEGLELMKEVAVPFLPTVKIYENKYYLPRAYGVYRSHALAKNDEGLEILMNDAFEPSQIVLLDEGEHGAGGKERGDAWGGEKEGMDRDAQESVSMKTDIVRWDNGKVVVGTDFEKDGYLFLSQTWYPGWYATVDGREAKIWRANYSFQAVAVPAGVHTVVFDYRPRAFIIGGIISLTTLLGIGMACMAMEWRSIRTKSPYA